MTWCLGGRAHVDDQLVDFTAREDALAVSHGYDGVQLIVADLQKLYHQLEIALSRKMRSYSTD